MKYIVSFEEVSSYVKRKYSFQPQFQCVDYKTLRISYKPGFFVPAISIDCVKNDFIRVMYNCSSTVSMIISKSLDLLKQKNLKGLNLNTQERCINVNVEEIEQLKRITTILKIGDILFTADGLEINIGFK